MELMRHMHFNYKYSARTFKHHDRAAYCTGMFREKKIDRERAARSENFRELAVQIISTRDPFICYTYTRTCAQTHGTKDRNFLIIHIFNNRQLSKDESARRVIPTERRGI